MSRSIHLPKREPRNVPEWRQLLARRDERREARRAVPRNAQARGFVLVGMLQSIAAVFVSLSVWF